jgi:hypothetical protein
VFVKAKAFKSPKIRHEGQAERSSGGSYRRKEVVMRVRSLCLVALGACIGLGSMMPAFADDDWHRHDRRDWREHDWREHDRREHEWREHEWRERHRYYAPPVVEAPAPGYGYGYAPPPVYYANPGYYR